VPAVARGALRRASPAGQHFRKPDTAGYGTGSAARQSSGSGPPGSGTLSVTAAILAWS
jgi:hypothetical protein